MKREPPEGAAAAEGGLQPVVKPGVVHRAGKLRHPVVLGRRLERLDVEQVPGSSPASISSSEGQSPSTLKWSGTIWTSPFRTSR